MWAAIVASILTLALGDSEWDLVGLSPVLKRVPGVNLTEIPDILYDGGAVVIRTLDKYPAFRFYDTAKASSCLEGKPLVILGDSTVEETVLDLALLLSGVSGYSGANEGQTMLDDMVYNWTHMGWADEQAQYMTPPMTGENVSRLLIHFDDFMRKTRVERPIEVHGNLSISYRFTGHHQIWKNDLGIQTWNHPAFKEELECYLGLSERRVHNWDDKASGHKHGTKCAVPAVVIINSGEHDFSGKVRSKQFRRELEKFYKFVANQTELANTRFIWRGNILSELRKYQDWEMENLDYEAYRLTVKYNHTYVNTSKIYEEVFAPLYDFTFEKNHITADNLMHVGVLARYKLVKMKFGDSKKAMGFHKMFLSSLVTQQVLNAICCGSASDEACRQQDLFPGTI